MIGLLHRDPALRLAPIWVLVAPLIASALEGVRMNGVVRAMRAGVEVDPFGQTALVALALWLPTALALLFLTGTPRCSRLDLTLPVAGRRLWTAHVIGVFGAGGLVLLACTAVVKLKGSALQLLFGGDELATASVGGVLLAAAGTLFLAVVALQSFHPGRRDLPRTLPFRAIVFVVASLGYVLVLLLSRGAPWLAALPFVAGAGLFFVARGNVPESLTLIRRQAVARAATRSNETTTRWTASGSWGTLGILSHILVSGIAPGQLIQVPVSWMGAPFVIAWGALIAGYPLGLESRLTFSFLGAYILLAFWPAPLNQLALLDPLPISRRKLFALVTVPGFALMAAGFIGGRVLLVQRDAGNTLLPPSSPIVFTAVILFFLVLAAIYLRTFRAHISDGRRKATYFGLLAGLILVQVGIIALLVSGVFNPFEASVVFEAAIENATTTNAGIAAVCWIGSAALLAFGYWLAEREFGRIEVPIGQITRES